MAKSRVRNENGEWKIENVGTPKVLTAGVHDYRVFAQSPLSTPMLRLLRTISWRHVQHHRLRTSLTFLGMALGVAVIVAIAMVNRALTTSFQSTIEQIAGKAVLQVSNSESGMNEAVLPQVRDTEGVLDVAAAVDGFLPVRGARAERLYIYGVDLLTDFTMRDHQFVGGDFGFD